MPTSLTSGNIPTYAFYLAFLIVIGAAEYLHLLPSGMLFGAISALGIGHGVATSAATKTTLRETTAAYVATTNATPPEPTPSNITPISTIKPDKVPTE